MSWGEGSANSSYLPHMTPETSPWSDLALDAPTVYYDPDAKVAIAPVWTDGGSAGVSVTGEGSARFPSSTSIE